MRVENENFKIEAARSSIDSTGNYIRDVEYRLDGENHRAFRGKGIGSKLIQMAAAFAKEQQIGLILTHVESANKASIAFYKNRGFQLAEVQGHRLLIRKAI